MAALNDLKELFREIMVIATEYGLPIHTFSLTFEIKDFGVRLYSNYMFEFKSTKYKFKANSPLLKSGMMGKTSLSR